jgi:hypothetical protein
MLGVVLQLQGTAVAARGLQALTGLSSLRRLFLDSNQSPSLPNAPPTPHSLLSVSELTQLTALEVCLQPPNTPTSRQRSNNSSQCRSGY